MSDGWYRTPPDLPPYEDGFGRLWALDGTQVGGPAEEPTPAWLAEWPEDLQSMAFQAAINMELLDAYRANVEQELARLLGL
jgi:hypothetical protein